MAINKKVPRTSRPSTLRYLLLLCSSILCNLLILAICALLLGSPALMAQTSSVSGRVFDPAGAFVPGADIELTRVDTGAKIQSGTNSEGIYIFPFVSPGEYRLDVTAAGFKKFEQTAITVQTGQRAAIDIRLELGANTESITVEANVASVNTVDATRGNAFDTRSILQLPLEGRNVAGLLSLQAGVASISDDPQSRDIRNGAVNGAQTNQSNVTLDGVDVNDQDTKLPLASALRTTLDAVQEFRVVTTNANADRGRSSGAQVSLITKSGTNDFHGSLYEFHRNNATAANDFFNNRAGVEKPKLIRNVFGGSLGGPIARNRAFYNYEGRRDASDSTETRIVPLQSFRNGNVRYLNTAGEISELSPAYLRSELDPLGIGPNPALLDYMRQYPLPNDTSVGDGINTGGYRFTSPTRFPGILRSQEWTGTWVRVGLTRCFCAATCKPIRRKAPRNSQVRCPIPLSRATTRELHSAIRRRSRQLW